MDDIPTAPQALLNDCTPLPRFPANRNMSCHLDSILMAFWGIWRHGALTVGNSGALFKQVYDFVAFKMNSSLTTTEMLSFHRDQLWTVLESAGMQARPGMTANVNDVLQFIMGRIGVVALNANFEATYNVVEHCPSCGHFLERMKQSESYFEGDETVPLPAGISRLEATLTGVSRTQQCPHCEDERMLTYRSRVKPNRALVICNTNSTLNAMETEWPMQAQHDDRRVKLTALIVCIRGHFLCLVREPGLHWLLFDDLHGVSRHTWDNLQQIFYRSPDEPLNHQCTVVTLFYVSHS